METYDAVIVGARCAGAAVSQLLARRGLRVLAVDRAPAGSDTLSTHALMRAGVLQLAHLGVLPEVVALGTPPIRTTSFHYGDEVVRVAIKARDGVDALYAPRRFLLDAALAKAADAAGATVRFGCRVVGLRRTRSGRVRGVVLVGADGRRSEVASEIVIGADGLRSTVADLVKAEIYRQGTHSCGVLLAYWSGLDVPGFEWHYRPGVSAGVIPTSGGETCVFVAAPSPRVRGGVLQDVPAAYAAFLAAGAPAIALAVSRSARRGPFRAFAGRPGFLRRSQGPGWALVGDAGYFRDPLTAHGMTDALRDAELLARAVATGRESALAAYQEERDGLSLAFFEASDRIASFQWSLEQLKEDHLLMSREMNREVAHLLELHPASPPPAEENAGAGQGPGLRGRAA